MIDDPMQVAVIDVQGMSSGNCAHHVESVLRNISGVSEARVDLSREEAHIVFDGTAVSMARLMQSINDSGYTALGFTRGPATMV